MKKKRVLWIILALLLVLLLLCVACGRGGEAEADATPEVTPGELSVDVGGAETPTPSPKPVNTPAPTTAPVTSTPAPGVTTTPPVVSTPAPTPAPSVTTPAPTVAPAPAPPSAPVVSAPAPTPAPEQAHTHDWQLVNTTVHHDAVYETVHHDAVTEQVKVIDQEATEAWTETVRTLGARCYCGAWFATGDEWQAHAMNFIYASDEEFEAHSGYASDYNETSVYHEATPEISHYETVETSPAYDEQILDHYICSCGATKAA